MKKNRFLRLLVWRLSHDEAHSPKKNEIGSLRRSSIRSAGQDFDDDDISLTRIDTARRGLTEASQNELYISI